jgi:gliding motility-associated-like protein
VWYSNQILAQTRLSIIIQNIMNKFRLVFLLLLGGTFLTSDLSAQLVGDQIFMQGRWLEVGVAPNGSWGNSMPVPATYHSHTGSFPSYIDPITGVSPGANGLDFSYDAGHDGWTVGSPVSGTNCCFYGAYFLPGTPFDGWAVQMNGVRSDAYYTGSGFALGAGATAFTGTNTSYVFTAGSPYGPYLESTMAGNWAGNYSATGGSISIRSTNRLDTNANWDLVTVTFRNTGATPVTGLYYLVTADPDNDQVIPGSFPTDNHICYQDDAFHRVEVNAVPPSGVHPDAFSGLATKDCRAKAIIYNSWPSAITVQLSDMWAGTTPASAGPYYMDLGRTTISQDIAYGLVYNLGDIAPGDSTRISFAWIFSDSTAIDSAFRNPQLVVNGAPAPLADTFYACGLDSVTISLAHAEWGLTEWTWAPATGLSGTRGLTNKFDPAVVSASGITYTLTGTDPRSCVPLQQFTVYVPPCHSASSNSPDTSQICEGDTLKLYDNGDSTLASYVWYGPGLVGGSIGSTQNIFRYPATMADTGWYYSIKTVGVVTDTVRTHVMIRLRPLITATYNPPVCSGNTLLLYSNPDYVGETWDWSGPLGYTSTLSDPAIPTAITAFSGPYKVIVSLNGCVDSATVNVVVDSTPGVPAASSNSGVCEDSTLTLFGNSTTAGVTYTWTGPSGYFSTLQNPTVPSVTATSGGTYTLTTTLPTTVGGGTCTNRTTTTVVIKPTPHPVLGSNSPVCSGNALNLTTTAPAGSTFDWTGPLGFTDVLQYPTINPAITANSGTYTVVVNLNGCPSLPTSITVVVDSTPEVPVLTTNSPGPPGNTICEDDTLTFTALTLTAGSSYYWTGPNSFVSTDQNPFIMHATPLASGIYTVVATLGSCSASATIIATVTPTPPITLSSNTPVCSGDVDSILLFATGNPGSTFTWYGPYTFFSNAQNPIRNPVSVEYTGVYHATVLLDGCTNTATTTVVVNPTPTPPWVKWLTYCQNYDAPYLQAIGSNILWYTSSAPGTVGSTTPPKPATDVVGVKFYFTNQTALGCPSAIDSIRVVTNPSPTVTVSPDVTVCPWDSVVLSAVNTDPIAYFHWYPSMYVNDTAAATVIVRPETNMDYSVVSTNMYGCTDTATVSVTVKANAVINLPDSVMLYPGETYQIQPSTNCSKFSWTPSGGLSGKYISNPVASPQVSTKYVLTGVTEWGCKTKDSINVTINDESVLTLPNAFAPGTGTNGIFRIIKRGQANLLHFRVYDRWGVVVFQTSNIDEGWDGTYKGTPQPVGVYVYDVTAVTNTGKAFNKSGNVTLLR